MKFPVQQILNLPGMLVLSCQEIEGMGLIIEIEAVVCVKGINNKLKLIKRLGYGFRNFDNFRLHSLLSWHFSINSI